jgi:phospholipid transport system substrate-binding protein
LVLLIASTPAVAQELAPDAMVRQVTEDVLTVVRQDKDIQSGNTKKGDRLGRNQGAAVFQLSSA